MRWALILLAACAAGAPAAPTRARPLGLNDVSILLPLPRDPQRPVLAAAPGVIERRWFDALVTAHGDLAPRVGGPVAFADYQVVALRFDLCDRAVVGACPPAGDGRVRLVLQPMYRRGAVVAAHDLALHAFYAVPAGEVAAMVGELRGLAALQPAPPDAPLGVSAAAANPAYLARLRGLVERRARPERLVRLTVIGQLADSAAFAWVFRGLDRAGDGFAPTAIPGVPGAEQSLQLAGGDTVYRTQPLVDAPAGFALATNGPAFAAAAPADRAAALEALTAIQNPLRHDTVDVPCVACHVATFLTARRAEATGVAPAAIAGRYASPRARAAATIASRDARVIRGFGWAASAPAISQRVANDSAQVLAELDARFPAP